MHNTATTNNNNNNIQTANNLKKSFQSDKKEIKNTAQNLKDRWEAKRLHGQFPHR
jgi:hypothetical protein